MVDGIQGIGNGPMMPPMGQMGQNRLNKNQKNQLLDIISKYDFNSFGKKEFKDLGEELRQAGFGQTREIKNILEKAGLNVDQFQQRAPGPMPGGPGPMPRGGGMPMGDQQRDEETEL